MGANQRGGSIKQKCEIFLIPQLWLCWGYYVIVQKCILGATHGEGDYGRGMFNFSGYVVANYELAKYVVEKLTMTGYHYKMMCM